VLNDAMLLDEESMRPKLDPALHEHLHALITEPLKAPAGSSPDAIDQDAQQIGLRLRERRLRREGQELHALLAEAGVDHDMDGNASLYQARQANASALLRLQQILSARTITRHSTAELWGRS
jgi:methylmalonyl-CoA mutase cobalamin-binding subunit